MTSYDQHLQSLFADNLVGAAPWLAAVVSASAPDPLALHREDKLARSLTRVPVHPVPVTATLKGLSGESLQHRRARPRRAQDDLNGLGRGEMFRPNLDLLLDAHSLDDPLDRLLDDFGPYRDGAIGGCAAFLVRGPPAALGAPRRGASWTRRCRWRRECLAAAGAPFIGHNEIVNGLSISCGRNTVTVPLPEMH